MRVPANLQRRLIDGRRDRVCETVVRHVGGSDAPALNRILDGLNSILELSWPVEQSEARSDDRLVVDSIDGRESRRDIVLVRIVEVVRVAAEGIVLDKERLRVAG